MRDVKYCVAVCVSGLGFCAIVAGMSGGALDVLRSLPGAEVPGASFSHDAAVAQDLHPVGVRPRESDVVLTPQHRERRRRAQALKRL